MKLRATFPFRQLLSAAVLVLGSALAALGQGPGTDAVTVKTTPPKVMENVLITGVTSGRVMVRDTAGEFGYPLEQIESVRKAAPPEFQQGSQRIEAGDMEGALPLLKTVVDRYRGLPTQWAQDSAASIGNIYLSLNRLNEAEAAIAEFKKSYGATGSAAASVAEARLLATRGKLSEAKRIAEPIVRDAMSKKNIPRAESQLYGQAYFVLGQVAEGEKKLPEAMENYCRTVAIFYQERSVVAAAQKRIDELQKQGVNTP